MDHSKRVQHEFSRQGEFFQSSPALRAAEITARIGAALGQGHDRVLDVACGPGILFPTLSSCARTVVGVDLTLKSLQLARQAEAESAPLLVRGISEALPFRAGSFDAIVLRLALHHFLEPQLAIESAKSALRRGGRIIVLDLLAPEDSTARPLRDAIERLRDPSHTTLLSREKMLDVLDRAGFEKPTTAFWSQRREFAEWARIINEPQRMEDVMQVLAALSGVSSNLAGLELECREGEVSFTYSWGLFVATAA